LVQSNAARILGERALELATPAHSIVDHLGMPDVPKRLTSLAAELEALHRRYEEHFSPGAGPGTGIETPAQDDVPVSGTASGPDNEAATEDLVLRFDGEKCIHSRQCVLNAPEVFLANVEGPWLHPEKASVEHLVHVARTCPSGAITYQRLDGGDEEGSPRVNVAFIREDGPYAFHATLGIKGQDRRYRATLCRCGQSRNKPFCDNRHRETGFKATGEPATLPSEPLPERGGELRIEPLEDGPLKITGPVEICSGTGRTISRLSSARLCRCGASSNKPFCDGSHQRIGFRSG
jgi:CDGSH-type Zn-finger protein/uncharacterized Fe-S cluster protein YjdI